MLFASLYDSFELIVFIDANPGQRLTSASQFVAPACEFLFRFEKLLACHQPFFATANFLLHCSASWLSPGTIANVDEFQIYRNAARRM